jgi:hypothetical protein
MFRSIILISLLPLILFACSIDRGQKYIEVKRIQYDVSIKNNDPSAFWWAENLEGSVREEVLGNLFEKAYSGKIKVYDYFHNPLTPEQARNVGTDTVYQTLRREYPPYVEYDTMVINTISYRDVSVIRFLEEWKIDRRTMETDKRVIGLGPVYVREYGDERYKQLLFWTYFDEQYPGILQNN